MFEMYWPQYLSRKQLEDFLRRFGYPDANLLEVANAPGVDPLFVLREPNGNLTILRIRSFRAHNQFLEVGLKWGLLGLALYLVLLALVFKGVINLFPASTGLFAIHVFFLFWFSIPEEEGVLWALWGAALGHLLGPKRWGR